MKKHFSLALCFVITLCLLVCNSSLNVQAQLNANFSNPASTEFRTDCDPLRELERSTFNLINEERIKQGLSAIPWSEQLADLARLHSRDMMINSYFSHESPGGKQVSERAGARGLNNWRAMGENIAYIRGYEQPDAQIVDCWLSSAGHRRNILKPEWDQGGLGVAVTGEGDYYFTQIFMRTK
ncbi:MAG: CAP domain-containing protein [Pyrinomonadaceae bacterium]